MAKKKATKKKADTQNLGLFKETLSVLFGLHPTTIDRIMAIVSNSEDKLNVKTYIARDKAGPRAIAWLRKAIEYGRHEGSAKHEDGSDDFEFTKDMDLESTARNERPQEFEQPRDDKIDMEKPIKECTFRDYLLEFESSAETSNEIHRDVEMAAKRPDAYSREQMKKSVNAKRDVQQSEDPDKAQKLRIINKRLQAQKEEDMLRKRSKQGGERPVAGMA